MGACLLLLCLFQFFSTKPRDWLGRTSPYFCVEWDEKPQLNQLCSYTKLLSRTCYSVLTMENWQKGCGIPSFRSLLLDQEKMKSVGDFSLVGVGACIALTLH